MEAKIGIQEDRRVAQSRDGLVVYSCIIPSGSSTRGRHLCVALKRTREYRALVLPYWGLTTRTKRSETVHATARSTWSPFSCHRPKPPACRPTTPTTVRQLVVQSKNGITTTKTWHFRLLLLRREEMPDAGRLTAANATAWPEPTWTQ